MIALDLLWLLMLWVAIGLFVAIAIGRASDLGEESDEGNEMTAQSQRDTTLEAPQRRHTARKRLADLRNKNIAEADKTEETKKNRKRAA
jgi:hypothetical protein